MKKRDESIKDLQNKLFNDALIPLRELIKWCIKDIQHKENFDEIYRENTKQLFYNNYGAQSHGFGIVWHVLIRLTYAVFNDLMQRKNNSKNEELIVLFPKLDKLFKFVK